MNLTRIITITIVTVAAVIEPICATAEKPIETTDTDTVDHRPFLKRIFKDFPTLYTDTAYTTDSYIVVIRAVLLNNKWHRHHSDTKIALPSDSDSTLNTDAAAKQHKPMVIFKKVR